MNPFVTPEPALLYVGNGEHRFASVHRDAIATLYAPGVRTARPGPTTWAPTRTARQ